MERGKVERGIKRSLMTRVRTTRWYLFSSRPGSFQIAMAATRLDKNDKNCIEAMDMRLVKLSHNLDEPPRLVSFSLKFIAGFLLHLPTSTQPLCPNERKRGSDCQQDKSKEARLDNWCILWWKIWIFGFRPVLGYTAVTWVYSMRSFWNRLMLNLFPIFKNSSLYLLSQLLISSLPRFSWISNEKFLVVYLLKGLSL